LEKTIPLQLFHLSFLIKNSYIHIILSPKLFSLTFFKPLYGFYHCRSNRLIIYRASANGQGWSNPAMANNPKFLAPIFKCKWMAGQLFHHKPCEWNSNWQMQFLPVLAKSRKSKTTMLPNWRTQYLRTPISLVRRKAVYAANPNNPIHGQWWSPESETLPRVVLKTRSFWYQFG